MSSMPSSAHGHIRAWQQKYATCGEAWGFQDVHGLLYEKRREFLERHRHVPAMPSESQLIRRLRGIPESVWRGPMPQIAGQFYEMNSLKIWWWAESVDC